MANPLDEWSASHTPYSPRPPKEELSPSPSNTSTTAEMVTNDLETWRKVHEATQFEQSPGQLRLRDKKS